MTAWYNSLASQARFSCARFAYVSSPPGPFKILQYASARFCGQFPANHGLFSFNPFPFTFFQTLLHPPKTQPFCFHAIPNSLRKTPGGGVRVCVATLLPWRVFGDFHDAFAFQ